MVFRMGLSFWGHSGMLLAVKPETYSTATKPASGTLPKAQPKAASKATY